MTVSSANTKSVLLLRPQDIKDVLTMQESIELIDQGYREAQSFPIINAPRRRVHSKKNIRISNFPGGVDGLGVIGSLTRADKISHIPSNQDIPYREHPVYLLWDPETGYLLSVMFGEITEKSIGFSSIMALRTGATSGVGFRYMARKNARKVGVYGTGGQALHKILALKCEREIDHIKIYSRSDENRRKFAEQVEKIVGVETTPVDNPREAIRNVDVVICATSSNVPVFDGNWIEPGQHIVTVVGSNAALVKGGWLQSGRRENDDVTVQRADFIVTNWRESVESEQQAGLIEPLQKGLITWDKIHELGELIIGTFPGRTSDEQITFHANNNGTAAADMALAKRVYDRCKAMGRGMEIELPVPGQQ
jgi:ornithine cyclodeaminase/alanine dehydrogenase-like protein (mu-crystallin family)